MAAYKPVTLRNAPETADKLRAFALQFYAAGSGAPLPLEWITDRSLVERLANASGLRSATPDPPFTALQHDLLLRTDSGDVRTCRVYRCSADRPGALTFSDGMTRSHPDLHAVFLEAYRLARYLPREEARRAKMRVVDEQAETSSDPKLIKEVKACIADNDSRGASDPWVVVVWNDYPDQTVGRDWADFYLSQRPDNTLVMQAAGLNGLVDALRTIRSEGTPVRQVIMAVHGTEAEFDLRSPLDPFNSQFCCGLYDGQVVPTDFALAIAPYMDQQATITLISCSTAGTESGHDGRELMEQISRELRCYDLATDQEVFLTVLGLPTDPYTSGTIYRSTPAMADPQVYLPAQVDQRIPIGFF